MDELTVDSHWPVLRVIPAAISAPTLLHIRNTSTRMKPQGELNIISRKKETCTA